MWLTAERAKTLFEAIAATSDEETACDECLQGMAAFAESELGRRSIPQTGFRVRAHVDRCRECREEYEALRGAIQALEEPWWR